MKIPGMDLLTTKEKGPKPGAHRGATGRLKQPSGKKPVFGGEATAREKKRPGTKDQKRKDKDLRVDATIIEDVEDDEPPPPKPQARGGRRPSGGREQASSREQKSPAQSYVSGTEQRGVAELQSEFQRLQGSQIEQPRIDSFLQHPTKNRYRDVKCVENTRIKLTADGESTDDYIHANYVGTKDNLGRFICTQAPMATTVKDFWRMIYQTKCGCIVMLCDTTEQGKSKCYEYWPVEGELTFGIYTVQCRSRLPSIPPTVSSDDEEQIVTTELVVTQNGDAEKALKVVHHHWQHWPDRGVPVSSTLIISLLSGMAKQKDPVTVHCSAGIGRTGTVVALQFCLDKLNHKQPLNVFEMVEAVRRQRLLSVQTQQQYLFLHKTLIEQCIERKWASKPDNHDTFITELNTNLLPLQ